MADSVERVDSLFTREGGGTAPPDSLHEVEYPPVARAIEAHPMQLAKTSFDDLVDLTAKACHFFTTFYTR